MAGKMSGVTVAKSLKRLVVVIRRLIKPSGDSRTKSSREAHLEKERHQALAMAQLQSTRYFR